MLILFHLFHQEKEVNARSCCGATQPTNKIYNIMMDDYTEVEGYNPDADLGLGCGLPTAFAQIKKGDTVIDLGSGAGNDCFVARHEAGESGKIIGIDFTLMIKHNLIMAQIVKKCLVKLKAYRLKMFQAIWLC